MKTTLYTILLAMTISDNYQQADSLSQYLIRWAKVSVSDGERTVVLTGKFDSRYFPPYVYTTGNMRGEAGKTYTLDVEHRDFHATATTTIPETHRIENLTIKPCADSDTALIYPYIAVIDWLPARSTLLTSASTTRLQ